MPNTTIWKYAIPVHQLDNYVDVVMPLGAEPLSCINQDNNLTIYAKVDPKEGAEGVLTTRRFRVAGTGHLIRPRETGLKSFMGTVLFPYHNLVFHVFDMGEV